MDSELLNLLQNFKIDDSMINSCLNILFQSSLTEEQYENIIEICNDKLEEIKNKKNIEQINQRIMEFKQYISQMQEFPYLLDFLENIYKIKAYMNDENEITEKKPSIEYVIEMNYQKENLTFFYTNVYDNVNQTIVVNKCITIEPEKDDSDGEGDSDEEKMSEDEKMSDEEMSQIIKFDEDSVEKLIQKMNWDISVKPAFISLLNTLFSIFESDKTFNW